MSAEKPGKPLPERYAIALGDADPIEVMATSPDRIRKLIAGLTDAQLSQKPAPGKWSIKEIIGHLADGEVILGSRYRFIGAQDRPPLPGYDQEAFVARLGVANAKAQDLLDDFSMARAVNLGLLDRMPDEAWHRVGIHAERGEESIAYLVAMYAAHDRSHTQQIETIRVGLFPQASTRRPAKTAKTAKPAARKTSPKRAKPAPAKKKAPARRAAPRTGGKKR